MPWSGTLVAEWSDWGIPAPQLDSVRMSATLVAGWAVFGLFALVVGAPELLLSAVAFPLVVEIIRLARNIRGLRRPARFRLALDDVLRVGPVGGNPDQSIERTDASVLTQVRDRKGDQVARLLTLSTTSGSALEIRDRLAVITHEPFAFASSGMAPVTATVPVSVLIGTWWPQPSGRVAEVSPRGWNNEHSWKGPWDQPDLDGYPRFDPRGLAMFAFWGAVLVAVAAAFAVWIFQAQTPYGHEPGELTAWRFGGVAVIAGAMVWGTQQLWNRTRTLVRVRARQARFGRGVILNRHG